MVIVESFSHGEPETPRFSDDLASGSASSTPFASAPSSPGRGPPPGYFFSAPSSPMHHFFLSSAAAAPSEENPKLDSSSSSPGDFEFDFSSRLSSSSGGGPLGGVPMTSAEELFSNGQIKPMKLSSHLEKPQVLAPLLDLETEEEDGRRGRDLMKLRSRSVHRKARSLSPLRNAAYQWNEEEEEEGGSEVKECIRKLQEDYETNNKSNGNVTSAETTPSCSASSSRSSSYGRNSKKWIFLKDLLHRSKSEGSGKGKEKFWSNISFSPSSLKDKKLKSEDAAKKQKEKQPSPAKKSPTAGKPTNGLRKRRGLQPSAHELHYTTNRAQAEEMKKRTYLPYRHGLFGCLAFSSKGYSALNGLARSLNPVSSG
ncbi:hypothetical protein Rs2_34948 [Raphanus sativus]|uniref:Uncharacterized protein LOC108832361 n=1 Tax=Raphanus sativus TaxID=3726 RepID=A0A6J0LN90_RAPSA|nr:uncharacterized protein LOC108832361 [Raphanus sativus]KAJ4884855.1 hypothetical protein Rs2_34948 [Raphanus sativus]